LRNLLVESVEKLAEIVDGALRETVRVASLVKRRFLQFFRHDKLIIRGTVVAIGVIGRAKTVYITMLTLIRTSINTTQSEQWGVCPDPHLPCSFY